MHLRMFSAESKYGIERLTSCSRSITVSVWPLFFMKECNVPFGIQGNTAANIDPNPCVTPSKEMMFGCSSLLKRPSSRRRTCHPRLMDGVAS